MHKPKRPQGATCLVGASLAALALLLGISMTAKASTPVVAPRRIAHESWGALPDGTPVELYALRNRHGMEVRIATYGGIVTYLTAPDRHGKYEDVVLGYDTLAGYLKASPYFGALIGRYGNRIARGRFTLDGVSHTLAINDPPNSLHGGMRGFDKVVWEVRGARVGPRGCELTLHYLSRDGEEGYPGNLDVTAVYLLTENDGLHLEYRATTDAPTILSLTQHSYFNLHGQGRGHILDHRVQINAARFTPVDATLIPTGELRGVVSTPFDFRAPTEIGARIDQDDEQLHFGRGYDHNWVIDPPFTGSSSAGITTLRLDAAVYDPDTGRVLEVLSDQPGLQFYTGNFLDGTITGKGGRIYQHRGAFCMEPQHFPDSPNRPDFPSTVLRPAETYVSRIEYRFSARP